MKIMIKGYNVSVFILSGNFGKVKNFAHSPNRARKYHALRQFYRRNHVGISPFHGSRKGLCLERWLKNASQKPPIPFQVSRFSWFIHGYTVPSIEMYICVF